MRKLVFFMHTSLDGFVAGLKGELSWVKVDDELFDFVATMTAKADTALYGRVTYEMMQSYWPTAGQQPNATKHASNIRPGTPTFQKWFYQRRSVTKGLRTPGSLATGSLKTSTK